MTRLFSNSRLDDLVPNLFHPTMNNNMLSPNTPENQTALFNALIKFVAETKDIHADSVNPFHKSKYASLSKHLSELKGIAAKHGLAIVQFPIGSYDGEVGVRTIIIHTAGGHMFADAVVPVEKGMKGQDAGALYSYIRRYALAACCGVATEDDDQEGDRQSKSASAPAKTVTKYIPNPNAEKATLGKGQSSAVAPFGDAKGTPLSALPLRNEDKSKKCADLNYWANVWEPRPFGDSGKISAKDLSTKSEAQRLWAEANSTEQSPVENNDEVPF